MYKQSFIGVTITLMLLLSSMVLTQNRKETAHKSDDSSEIIIRKDKSFTAGHTQFSYGQQSIIFLDSNDNLLHYNQLKTEKNVIVFLKTVMDSTFADTLNAVQTGEGNRIYLYNLSGKSNEIRQAGKRNRVYHIQVPDTGGTGEYQTRIRQSGNSNSAVIIQN